jgi:glutathione S-transferase
MARPLVYGVDGSPMVYSAKLGLEEKGVDYELVPLDMAEIKQPAHLARQPFGRVPVLEHDGFMLYETQAILRYVDEAFDGPPLQPADARARARMNQIMGIIDWHFFHSATELSFERLVAPLIGRPPDEALIERALPLARICLAELERLRGEGPYLAGSTLSLADLLLAPQYGYLIKTPEGPALTAPHPGLAAWWAFMAARPCLGRAAPRAA